MESRSETMCMNCLKVRTEPHAPLLGLAHIVLSFHAHSILWEPDKPCCQLTHSCVALLTHAIARQNSFPAAGDAAPSHVLFLTAPSSCRVLHMMGLCCCRRGQGIQP